MTWKETYSGERFDLLAPQTSQVKIEDIAISLSHLARFNGHTSSHYSVAEHALHVSWLVAYTSPRDIPLCFCALHHDSQEAYTGDMIQPMKLAMRAHEKPYTPAFDVIDDDIRVIVARALGLPTLSDSQREAIKVADLVLLQAERLVLMPHTGKHPWFTDTIQPPSDLLARLRSDEWRKATPRQIRARFLSCHYGLTEKLASRH